MNILHLASFTGNIGDNASHIGLYKVIDGFFADYSVEKIEIRKFYKNYGRIDKKYFDSSFIEYINTFDLVIIGGGGFLDYWVPGSETGTTLDISPALIATISVPTLITSVGCVPHRDIPDGNIERFRKFLDAVNANNLVKIAVRNDGSVKSFRDHIGESYLDNIPEVLDSGFFYDVAQTNIFSHIKKYVAVNITHDQIGMNSKSRDKIDLKRYYNELAKTIEYIINNEKLDVVFIPHIYSDLKAISCLLDGLDDFYIRNHITVAPCIQKDIGADYLFSVYKGSELVLGTRYHANICSLAIKKPVIGLVALDRVAYLYEKLGLSVRTVDLNETFSPDLSQKISNSLSGKLICDDNNIDRLKIQTLEIYRNIFSNFGFSLA